MGKFFDDLLESVQQMDEILHKKSKPTHEFKMKRVENEVICNDIKEEGPSYFSNYLDQK
ncbi:hypothetical protein [Pseudomonas sp. MPB26]|uniref:hypothetical protein n=1 Tax=Pseudomonas sp. MPB26 TaxID=3388491 RepID=UPI0039851F7B